MSDLYANNVADSKYKCFWNILPVEVGALFISSAALSGCIFSATSLFFQDYSAFLTYLQLLVTLVGIFAYAGVLFGIFRTKPRYFLLCIFSLGFQMVLSVAFMFVLILLTNAERERNLEKYKIDHYLILNSIWLLFNIFCFDVIFKCYQYVSEKVAAASNKNILPRTNVAQISVAQDSILISSI
uniref:Uncharacterized protein n=1 Tax=Panagrolaimus sp. ES5 TaxID=591445 RepID=A0AC34GWP5_9BILA